MFPQVSASPIPVDHALTGNGFSAAPNLIGQ
jgi:hypothetical protein